MLEIIKSENRKSIIVFIHGFKGGRETWMTGEEQGSFIKSVNASKVINTNFDIGIFEYFTKITDIIEDVSWFWNFFKKRRKIQKNLPINDLSDLLQTEISERLKSYTNIILIAHSMGGLVAKSTILKLMTKNDLRIKLYVSLAVPHNGANLANIGKVIFGNPQLKNLAPLETFINQLNKDWIRSSKLPITAYFQGKLDRVVPKASSIGYDSRNIEPIYVEEDHFSITKPKNENDLVTISTKNLIESALKNNFSINNEIEDIKVGKNDIKNITNSTIVSNSDVNNSFNQQ